MPKIDCFESAFVVSDLSKTGVGFIIVKTRQTTQSLCFSDGRQPIVQFVTMIFAPTLEAQPTVNVPKQQYIGKGIHKPVVSQFEPAAHFTE